jgi:hypothetical protein
MEENTKYVFEELLNNYGIKKKNSNPFNPQSNGIIERVHLTLNDSLRAAEIDGGEMDKKYPWGPFLSSTAYAIRSTFHTTLKSTPAYLLFGRDMILPLKFMADWGELNNSAKSTRISHNYKVGDKVLLKKQCKHLRKLEASRTGPHTVTAIYTNGTLRIQKGKVNERVNIRRLFTYFENTDH